MVCNARTFALGLATIVACGAPQNSSAAHEVGSSTRHHRVLSTTTNGKPTYLYGNLGIVATPSSSSQGLLRSSTTAFESSAKATLETILDEHVGFDATRQDVTVKKLGRDKKGGFHFRFKASIDGMEVQAASMMMHVDEDGVVYALNGELVSTADVKNTKVKLDCNTALKKALRNSINYRGVEGKWVSACELTYVNARDGSVHKAWKRTLEYNNAKDNNRYAVDEIFASVQTGKVVAVLPTIHGAGLSVLTKSCIDTICSTTVSSSTSNITTADEAVNRAHNYAIGTYTFYNTMFGRDSINNAGMTIISNVHYGNKYNNAFWNGQTMTYGDGDGVNYRSFSMAADVVAHELTHGVTQFESGLVYSDESGAMNEAMSDIFGACVERIIYKKSKANTMLLGEDLVIGTGAFRSLSNPYAYGCYDYYPERYVGTSDNGGVHWNSGIMNLAFALMVNGGTHPRGKTTINVPAIDADFTTSITAAARIFYDTNANCLTQYSGFREARICTEQFAGSFGSSVSAAWEAVGVTTDMVNAISLTNGVTLPNQSANTGEVHYYSLSGVLGSETVTCEIIGPDGSADADLYVSNNGFPVVSTSSSVNSCVSTGSGPNQKCTTTPYASTTSKIYAAVKAVTSYTGLSIVCTRDPPPLASLKNGSPLAGQALKTNMVKYYSLEQVKKGETVLVQLSTGETNTDADLYVRWGALPVLSNGTTWSCYQYTSSSNETCQLTAPSDTTLYILVHAYAGFNALTVHGRHYPTSVQLTNGVALTSRSSASVGLIQDYQLTAVAVGDKVKCNLAGSSGDADLFVRFGALAETPTSSSVNACSSAAGSSSTETCTTPSATAATTAYAAVYTSAAYSGLSVSCSIVAPTPTTSQPTRRPTKKPTKKPTSTPTKRPTKRPTPKPTKRPTHVPTTKPTMTPTMTPTIKVTNVPTTEPTSNPTLAPTSQPTTELYKTTTHAPSATPSLKPTESPSTKPTFNPTAVPTNQLPSATPSLKPTESPSTKPSFKPTAVPTNQPTRRPTKIPTFKPTFVPTKKPTRRPIKTPTKKPTRAPTNRPTKRPTTNPTKKPTKKPVAKPTRKPTTNPTKKPTNKPVARPTRKPRPTFNGRPTLRPTLNPTSPFVCLGSGVGCSGSSQCCSGFCRNNRKCK